MKKILVVLLLSALFVSGCGNASNSEESQLPSEETSSTNSSQSLSNDTEEYLSKIQWGYTLGEVEGNKQYVHYDFYNNTDKYMDGAFYILLRNENDEQYYDAALIASNVQPGGTFSALACVPLTMTDQIENLDISVVRCNFSDKPIITPDLSYEDLYSYFIADYMLYDISYDKQTMSATIYNTTTKYFTGTISVVVTDPTTNEVVGVKDIVLDNLSPGDFESVLLHVDLANAYRRQLAIGEDFQLTDSPIIE